MLSNIVHNIFSPLGEFHFLRVYMLALIPLWFILKSIFHFVQKKVSGNLADVCDPRLLQYISVKKQRQGGVNQFWLQLALILSIIALAGPAWQPYPRPLMSNDSPLVIALDVSYSMDADDVKPSRLHRAKHKIMDLIQLRKEGQTALVIFAQHAFVVTPLSTDTQTLLSLLTSIDTSMMPTQGSRPDRAVAVAQELLAQTGLSNGHILIMTDDISKTAARGLQSISRNVPVSILDFAKEEVPIPHPDGGVWLNKDYKPVVTQRHPDVLKKLAHDLGGTYQALANDDSDIENLMKLQSASLNDYVTIEEYYDVYEDEGPLLLWLILPILMLALRRKQTRGHVVK